MNGENPITPPNPNSLPTKEDILLSEERLTSKGFEGTIAPDPLFASNVLREEEKKREPIVRETPLPREPLPPAQTGIKHVRTYQGDVAETLKKGKTSLVQMVMSEQEKKKSETSVDSPKNPRNLSFIITSVILIFLGVAVIGGGLYFAFLSQKDGGGDKTKGPRQSTLLYTEIAREINISGMSKNKFVQTLSNEVASFSGSLDSIAYLSFTQDIPSTQGGVVKGYAGASDFFSLADARIPQALARALGEEFVFGIHVFNGNTGFLVLTTDFYENAFAGMLSWESFLPEDLLPLFGKPSLSEGFTFKDRIIKNRDVRVLENETGDALLFYMFLDRKTLVIAETEDTLDEVVTRLQRPRR